MTLEEDIRRTSEHFGGLFVELAPGEGYIWMAGVTFEGPQYEDGGGRIGCVGIGPHNALERLRAYWDDYHNPEEGE